MYSKCELIKGFEGIGILPEDTLLVHSSMKSIGEVENGADTVLDAFIEYMKPGLLIFPTHTWDRINNDNPLFDPLKEPSCVGILTNLFMKRPGVIRSWHPTHSVAAIGKGAKEYVSGEEDSHSPCPRKGCYGKLYDRKAKILFLGCSLKKNTYLHGVEEWNNIPNRLSEGEHVLKILTPGGCIIDCPQHRHQAPVNDISVNYDKMESLFLHKNIARRGRIGNANSVLCDAAGMADMVSTFLKLNPDLFIDDQPVPEDWYKTKG